MGADWECTVLYAVYSVDRQTAAGSPGYEVLLARACRPAEICTAAKTHKYGFLRVPAGTEDDPLSSTAISKEVFMLSFLYKKNS